MDAPQKIGMFEAGDTFFQGLPFLLYLFIYYLNFCGVYLFLSLYLYILYLCINHINIYYIHI